MKSFDGFILVYSYIQPVLDVGILSFVLYKAYEIIVKTNSIQLIKSAVIVAVAFYMFCKINICRVFMYICLSKTSTINHCGRKFNSSIRLYSHKIIFIKCYCIRYWLIF